MGIIPQADPDKNIQKKIKENMSKRKLRREETKEKKQNDKQKNILVGIEAERESGRKHQTAQKQNSEWHRRLARSDHCTTAYCNNIHLFILILGFVLS